MTSTDRTVREGAWDCPSCGRAANRGPAKHCQECGAARGPEVQIYLPRDPAVVTDPEVRRRALAGPDWTCEYCGAENGSLRGDCHACGAARGDGPQRPVVQPPSLPSPQRSAPPPHRPRKKKGRGCLRTACGIGCLGMLLLFILSLFIDPNNEITATPYGYTWEQQVHVDHQVEITETAWEGEVPQDAQIQSSNRELFKENRIRTGTRTETQTVMERRRIGTERVKVGTKNLGNGYFEDVFEERPIYENVERTRQVPVAIWDIEPVYKNKVRYTVQRWRPHRTHRAYGTGRPEVWPDPDLANDEKERGRERILKVELRNSTGTVYEYEARNEVEWRRFRNSKSYQVETYGLTVRRILW